MPRPPHPKFNVNYSSLTGEELWNHYEDCLKYHDWSFQYSDDYSYFRLGKQERAYLISFCEKLKKLDDNRAVGLFNQYRPDKC